MTCTPTRASLLVCASLCAACSSSSGGPAHATTSTLVTGVAPGESAEYLVVDANNAYAATQTAILKIPLSGGASVALAQIPPDTGPSGLAVGESSVYWSQNEYSTGATQGTIYAVPIDGGTPATIAAIAGSATTVATDDTSVYWAASVAGTTCTTSSCENLLEAPLAGGAAVTLSTSAHAPTSFAFDGSNVYWGNGDGFLLRMPKTGGTPTVLADYATTSVVGVGLVGSTLYWGASGGDVYETPVSGGASKPLEVALSAMRGAAFTTDGLAWGVDGYSGQSETGTVAVTSLGGTTTTLWSSASEAPVAIAAHGTTVVFATSSGAVIKIAW
jgi:hypothetical protein